MRLGGWISSGAGGCPRKGGMMSGPTFCNMLPLDMRYMNISPALFKSKLKTFLFMRAFPGAFET